MFVFEPALMRDARYRLVPMTYAQCCTVTTVPATQGRPQTQEMSDLVMVLFVAGPESRP